MQVELGEWKLSYSHSGCVVMESGSRVGCVMDGRFLCVGPLRVQLYTDTGQQVRMKHIVED